MYTKAKIRIYTAGIYLLKVNNENSRTRCVIWKRQRNDLIDMRTLRNTDVPLVSLYLFLVFHSWTLGSGDGWVNQQKLKYRQVKIMKDTRADTNYPVLIKRVKLQHKKKPVLNLRSIESVGFQQTFTKFIEIFVPLKFLYEKKNRGGNHLVAINDISDVRCFDLYLINIFIKSAKSERWKDIMFKLTLCCLSVTVEDLNL